MSKKKLNTSAIRNELEGASLYFAKPQATPPPGVPQVSSETAARPGERENERISERNSEPPEKRSLPLPVKRQSRRYSFEVYDNQIVKLKKLKYRAEMRGERMALSDMVRQALDEFLKER